MKQSKFSIAVTLFLVVAIGFSSCKKDSPIIEDNQEEIDGTSILFTNIEEPEDVLLITFDKSGKPTKSHHHLTKNETYKMEISLYHNGEKNNQEFIDDIDEHKLFFLAPEDAVTNYVYKDNDLGLTGEITFGDHDSSFDLTVLLRHGLNKAHPAAKDWNSTSYQQAGGVDDLRISASIHLVLEEHDHD